MYTEQTFVGYWFPVRVKTYLGVAQGLRKYFCKGQVLCIIIQFFCHFQGEDFGSRFSSVGKINLTAWEIKS